MCFASNELGGSCVELCLDCGEFTLASGKLRFCLRALGVERCLGMGTLRWIGNLVDLHLSARKARFGLGTRHHERSCLRLVLAHAGIDLFLLRIKLAFGCLELNCAFGKFVLCGIELVAAVGERGGRVIQLGLGRVKLGGGVVELGHCRSIFAIVFGTGVVELGLGVGLHCRESRDPEVEAHALETCDERIGNRVIAIAWIQFVGSAVAVTNAPV